MPIEMITEDDQTKRRQVAALQNEGFYWREQDSVRVLICAPLEHDGFTNAFSTRLGGVSPMPQDALNLAGFNEDDAENIYENRRRFLKLFPDAWTLKSPAVPTTGQRSDQRDRWIEPSGFPFEI